MLLRPLQGLRPGLAQGPVGKASTCRSLWSLVNLVHHIPYQATPAGACKLRTLPMANNTSGGATRFCFGSPAFLNLHNRPPTQLHKPVHNLQPVCRRHSARHHQRICWWRPAFPAGCCHLGSHLAHGLALTRECHKNRCNVISTAAAAADHNKWHIAAAGLLPPAPWPHHPGWPTVVWPCGRKNKKFEKLAWRSTH